MFKTILLPTDGSELSEKAIPQGVALARALDARLVGVHVVPEYRSEHGYRELARSTASGYTTSGESVTAPPPEVTSADEYLERARAIAEHHLASVKTAAANAGVPCKCLHRVSDDPAGTIIDVAKEQGCDLIVMASHGHSGIKRLVLGSQTSKVLAHSKVPVLVYR